MSKIDKSLLLSTSEPHTRRRLHKIIRTLAEGEYAVTFTKKRISATTSQRGYYWGYLVPEVSKLTGLDRDATDKALCALFLRSCWNVAGESLTVVRSLSDLNPGECIAYFSEVRMWAWTKYRRKLSEPDALLSKRRL